MANGGQAANGGSGGVGGTAFGAAIGTGMGIGADAISRGSSYRQQKKLNEHGFDISKRLMDYQAEKQYQYWLDTNYSAQKEQMEKAGLNVATMYGGVGDGGKTASIGATASGGSASSANSGVQGMGIGAQAAMQLQLLNAQKENIEADTANKQAETAGTQAGTAVKIQEELKLQMENNYMGKGAYKDGMTGYEVRYQQEAAEMYNKVADTELKKMNLDQMPTRLQNEVQRVVLEGQRLKIDAMNARTAQERNTITERLEILRQNVAISMQQAGLNVEVQGQNLNNAARNADREQRDIHFGVNKGMEAIDKILSAAVPWYEPSTTTTRWTETEQPDGSYRETRSRETRRRN